MTIFGENGSGIMKYFAGQGAPPAGELSLEALVEHELGHVLGLADTNLTPGFVMGIWPVLGDAPMPPNDDEYTALASIYGPR